MVCHNKIFLVMFYGKTGDILPKEAKPKMVFIS